MSGNQKNIFIGFFRWKFRTFTVTAIALVAILLLALLILLPLYISRDSKDLSFLSNSQRYMVSDTLTGYTLESETGDDIVWQRSCGNNRVAYCKEGYLLGYVEGTPSQRGDALGLLMPDFIEFQERVFVERIREMIPSDSYLAFLRYLLGIYNRNLASHIPDDYKAEIYAMSGHCSDQFNIIGSPYERQLNYHAAHDIGHAMQRYMLVGCTSFGVWDRKCRDGNMLLGRNFDFYMGDDFARNKLVLAVRPDSGYSYVSITWPGMTGVVSGMNEKGLTVTINAAQGVIPLSSATPVSIVAKSILQYASTIDEALEEAGRFTTFASEQFLISSSADSCCATIEKSPEKMEVVYGEKGQIVNTNHFRGRIFSGERWNMENIANSDSPYRYSRVKQLLDEKDSLGVEDIVDILRDRYGLDREDIGFANQKSVNQLIAHHSVVFDPYNLTMWVALGECWSYGKYSFVDVGRMLRGEEFSRVISTERDIPEFTPFTVGLYGAVKEYKELQKRIFKGDGEVDIERFIMLNPNYYNTWYTAARFYGKKGDYSRAVECCRKALSLEVATEWERSSIIGFMEKLNNSGALFGEAGEVAEQMEFGG